MMDTLYLTGPKEPLLRTKLEKFDFENPPIDPAELSKSLYLTMMREGGLGLAANQVGLPYRVFVLRSVNDSYISCFNPLIVDKSSTEILLEEGCLSYKGMYVNIKRPKIIKVRYTQSDGQSVTRKFDGLTSRAYQHEMDHVDGIVHIDRLSRMAREKALKKWKKQNG